MIRAPSRSFSEYPDEVAEAAAVAKSIAKLIAAGTSPAEIAVLYRINAQSEVYEEALTEAGIAFQVRGGEGFFSRQEIRQALLALQRAADRDIAGLETCPSGARRCWNRWGSPPNRRRAPAPASAGRRWRRWRSLSTTRWRPGRNWTCPRWSPNCGCGPTPGTHRWCRA